MKQITSVLMVSALALSSVLPGVVHATENLASEKQVTDTEKQETTTTDTSQEVTPETREEETKTSEQPATEESETTEVPSASVEGESEKNSVQTKASNEEVTVTFINGSSLYKQSQVIANNTVAYPGTPELSEGQSNFLGWYTDPEAGVPFDFNTPVTNSITLYARFSNSYLIQFKDQTGKVIDSKEIEQGQSIPETTAELTPPQGQYFSYWYMEGDATQTPFSFETATASKDLVLVPKFASERTVLFISEGTQVDPAYVQDGEKVSKPSDPTREGWTFSHWATEQNGSTPYNFDAPVTDSLVLYAVWTPEETEYTVVFWKEKANIAEDPGTDPSNYAFSWSTKQTGQSGDKININQTTAESLVSGDSQATSALQYSEYGFSTEQTISGNGHTVINVYYKRIIYKLEFNLVRSGSVTQIVMEANGKQYSNLDSEKYSIYAKEGQYIGDLWPSTPVVYSTLGDAYWGGWRTPADSPIGVSTNVTNGVYLTDRYISTTPGKHTLTLSSGITGDSTLYEREQFTESLQATSEIYESKYYEIYRHVSYYGGGSGGNDTGFFPDRTGAVYGHTYAGTFYDGTHVPKDYYKKNIHSVSYNTQGGTFTGEGQISEKKYEEKIVEPSTPTREGYRFAGWYLDADYREKMNFDTFTMPDSDVTLFAKWESTQNTVRYFDGFGGTQLLQQGYSDNDDFVFPSEYVKGETYVEGKGVFNGWFWQVGSSTFEFSDTIPITKDIDLINFVTLNAEDKNNQGVLDPLVFLMDDTACYDLAENIIDELADVSQDFLTSFKNAMDIFLAKRSAGERVGLKHVFDYLVEHGDKEVKSTAQFLLSMSDGTLVSLVFSYGQNRSVSLKERITILEISGLDLPSKGDIPTSYQKKSLAVMYALGYFCTEFGKKDRNVETVEFFDEAWFFNSSDIGRGILKRMKRVGRSENNTLFYITQSINDIVTEDDTTSFGKVFAFLEKSEVEDVLKYLKIPINETTLLWMSNMTMGQCIYLDVFSRVARMTVDGLHEDIMKLYDTVNTTLKSVT